MKKIMALVLAAMMILSLVACGQSNPSTGSNTNTPAQNNSSTSNNSSDNTSTTSNYEWPTRPVNVTVAASAGGATDIIVRKYAEKFQEITGQPMVITNITGASAYQTTKTAAADGYNFGTMSTAFLTYKHQGMVDFTWDEGFDTAALFGVSGLLGFVVPKDSQFQTINDLVDYAKAHPGELTVGNGQGTPFYWQLAFQKATDTDLYTVHLGDTNELNVSLLGKQVDAIVSRYTAVKAYLESGDFRMLCFATEQRSEIAPDVPTCKESGIDYTFSPELIALMCPKGTPVEAREAINNVFAQIHADEAFMADINALGNEMPREYSITEMETFIAGAQDEINAVMELAEG
ncbi:MAG: tripartite tricarboxylate transporter substrate binding protein [Oscillospiraceae bacterium]|nr:tripartite tricarboxylate transporter substrate binding protein [Oscillospiraceae bacterium]